MGKKFENFTGANERVEKNEPADNQVVFVKSLIYYLTEINRPA